MTSTLSQLLFVYVLGGLTFLPLCLVLAWLALPKLEDGQSGKEETQHHQSAGDEKAKQALKLKEEELSAGDGEEETASGTFAVLRKYDFVSANIALTARSGVQNAAAAGGGGTDGATDGVVGSESVYQSMYRSVFDRSRTSTPPNALLNAPEDENANASDAKARKRVAKPASASTFYIVLRHGHLMLYDTPAQLEVRHVISLAHHSVALSEGAEGSDISVVDTLTDGDLFIKRTAIVLSPLADIANGALQAQALAPKPFYLFASMSIQKESFYHALLLAAPSPPIPQPLDPHDLIKLQTTLHSTLITSETRALNAVLSRIFLALSGTDQLKDFFRAKIEKKISRVQKPGFINALALYAIDLGAAAPVVANPRLKDLNISGDTTVSCDVRYTGGISLTLAAQARLDLGPRFKPRTVDLVLSSSLKRLSGHMLIRIKPPPSNRLWFCFDGMPDMEIKIEPVVSSRQITYGFILRQIEERIRAVVAETLVKPNWDDIPFFDTRSQIVRGGIWASESPQHGSGEQTPSETEMLARRGEKTMSMPVLPHIDPEAEATSSGSETPRRELEAELKRRSIVSLPPQSSSTPRLANIDSEERSHSPIQAPKPLRSPSFTSPSASAPSVALDDSSANFDPSHKLLPQRARTWGRRQAPPPPAVDAVREVRDRSFHNRAISGPSSGSEALGGLEVAGDKDDGAGGEVTTPERTATGLSTASSASASTTGTTASARSEGARQKRAANLLAAATTATTAAKDWGWKTIQSRAPKSTTARKSSEPPVSQLPQEPMGRGQPLPPPGQPLPRPQREKSLWAGSGFGVPGLSGSVKRRPVPSRRPVEKGRQGSVETKEPTKADVADEFGDWKENSGDAFNDGNQSPDRSGSPVIEEQKVPPPLPKRRRTTTIEDSAHEAGPVESNTAQGAIPARSPAAASSASNDDTFHSSGGDAAEVDLNTATHHLPQYAPSNNQTPPSSANATLQPSPLALPAEPADANAMSRPNDPEPQDLVVVAAPMESGRNTPVPSAATSRDAPLPAYDGNEWGSYDDDDDEVEDGEGVPKASFSRSRGVGEELYQ